MKKHFLLFSAVCLFFSGLYQVAAQTTETPPPNVLLIVREEIKLGKGLDHERESNRYTQILRKAKSPYGRIGMTPIAGNENEVIYVWGFDSFADLEKWRQMEERWSTGEFKADYDKIAQGTEDLHTSQRDMVAVYRPDLSYNPSVNIAEMRYFRIGTLRVRPGQTSNFLAAANAYLTALKNAKVDDHIAVYQVISGSADGIYLLFTPMKSLAEMDTYPARYKPFREALGPEGLKNLDKMFSEVFNPGESSIYVFNPRMSYVSDQFASRDTASPGFWNPKN